MKRAQQLAVLIAALLFAGLYLGFDTKPSEHKAVERDRALNAEATSPEQLLAIANDALSAQGKEALLELERQLDEQTTDAGRIEVMKEIAATWYQNQQRTASGIVAEQIAELENTDNAWSIAGATFFEALGTSEAPIVRQFCANHAVKAFESAASLAPDKIEHRVNVALVYAEQPPPDNPMQAVLILRDLEAKHPDAVPVYNALGRLAIKTAQWERAIQRLEKAYALEPDNPFTPCLLAKAYDGAGQTDKANEFATLCNSNRK